MNDTKATAVVEETPATEYTVSGAPAFVAVRDHSYRLGLTWYQSCAIAAYTVERHPKVPVSELLKRYYAYKTEAWYGDARAFFWMDFYGLRPTHPRY